MTTIGGITIPVADPLPPQVQDPGPTDGTGDGSGSGPDETGGTGETGGNGTGDTGGTGGNTGGNDTGNTGGTGTSGGTAPSEPSGTSGGGGTTRAESPSSTGKRAPAYTLDFSKPEETGPGDFTYDGVISESQRLDLAFARVLDAAMARRYAEAARLELISDGLLERLKDGSETDGAFARDVNSLRASEQSQEDRGFDRTA